MTFAAPWALAALVALPAVWWLLRLTPPAPRRVRFPPLRLLAGLLSREESVARTPWWLLALRLALVSAVILACARPMLNAQSGPLGDGPLALVVDNGWASGRDWDRRQSAMIALIERAERTGHPVVIATTAPESADRPAPSVALLPPTEARGLVEALQPKPWPTQRATALAALEQLRRERALPPGGETWWLSDGLDDLGGAGVAALAERLQRIAPLVVMAPEPGAGPLLLRPALAGAEPLTLSVLRGEDGTERSLHVLALSVDGVVIAREDAQLQAGDGRTEVRFQLPAEIAGRIARFQIDGETSAGGVVLADSRWQRRPVGLVAGHQGDVEPPLLRELYYLDRALAGFAEIRHGDPDDLLARDLAVLVLPDRARLDPAAAASIRHWVEGGGVFVRFAGPRLAAQGDGDDPLLPVRLRHGDRNIGGALSWSEPAAMAPFDTTSPFAGLDPSEEVVVNRQVLADPSFDTDQRVWARLEDGTPLVSARRSGAGWLILFHTTANAEWSTLALSGMFVDMLDRLVDLSRSQDSGDAGEPGEGSPLAPMATLDGTGTLTPPIPGARVIDPAAFADTQVSPLHPPGFYGNASDRRALNLGVGFDALRPLGPLPPGVSRAAYGETAERDLRGWLLAAALVLALVDLALSARLRGLLGRSGTRRAIRPTAAPTPASPARHLAAAGLVALGTLVAGPIAAETIVADGSAEAAALTTRLAYLTTGAPDTDAISRAGLDALAVTVNRRTAAELGTTVAVDPAVDELAFYPLLYWPVDAGTLNPSPLAIQRLIEYMRSGGTILFDFRHGAEARPPTFQALARRLEIPPLVPLPADHVLRRAYYLLADLPGRRTGDAVWVVDRAEQINDGVTPVIAGSHDWAGAWAADDAMRPMFAVVPGGEQQRELAFRFGVNLVMHVLTGNYKADQVHLPAIMERLGQ